MEDSRAVFPAKWVKWGHLWEGIAVGHNKRAAKGYLLSIALWAVAAYLFIVSPLTMPTMLLIGVIGFVGGIFWKNAKFNRWRYLSDDTPNCAVFRPRWQRMGGFDQPPPKDVIKSKHLHNKWPWVEKDWEYTIKTRPGMEDVFENKA
jgi:hypothetical protein